MLSWLCWSKRVDLDRYEKIFWSDGNIETRSFLLKDVEGLEWEKIVVSYFYFEHYFYGLLEPFIFIDD